jgi:hypothetical protein
MLSELMVHPFQKSLNGLGTPAFAIAKGWWAADTVSQPNCWQVTGVLI